MDINCDLGEGGTFDAEIMPLISSCNIACGGHFGNANSLKTAMQLAIQNSVFIGAHPSYPDAINLGRFSMKMNKEDLNKSIRQQLKLFFETANKLNAKVHHVKPHGALYHDVALNVSIAELFLEVVKEFDKHIIVYTAPNSVLQELEIDKDRIFKEVFADRAYHTNGNLVSRSNVNAVLANAEAVSKQVLDLATKNKVKSVEGKLLLLDFDTICFHSDSPNALKNLESVHQILNENHIKIRKANA